MPLYNRLTTVFSPKGRLYRGTSLIKRGIPPERKHTPLGRKRTPLGPYRRPMPRVHGGS